MPDHRRALISLVAALALVSGAFLFAWLTGEDEAEEADPATVVEAYGAAMSAGDIDGAMAFVADDPVHIDLGGLPIEGQEAYRLHLEQKLREDPEIRNIQVSGNTVTYELWLAPRHVIDVEGKLSYGVGFERHVALVEDGLIVSTVFGGSEGVSSAHPEDADPVGIVEAVFYSMSVGDVDAAMAFVAEDPVHIDLFGVPLEGREGMRQYLVEDVGEDAEIRNIEVSGNTVTYELWGGREAGPGGGAEVAQAVVEEGLIVSIAIVDVIPPSNGQE